MTNNFISIEMQKEINLRLKRIKAGESKLYSWNEVKQEVEACLKNGKKELNNSFRKCTKSK